MLGLPFLLTKPLMGNLAANEYKYTEADMVAFPLSSSQKLNFSQLL
jgi:hypothetical protein